MADGNGNAHATYTIGLQYKPLEGTLAIDLAVPNVDTAINICQQALRELETQLRQARALQFQQQVKEQADNQRIADMLRGKHA